MDLNLVVLAGRLAAPPEVRTYESGTVMTKYLVTVRSEDPVARVDVVPVTLWGEEHADLAADALPGHRLWVAGSVQRRFWSESEGRRSRLEVVADQVSIRASD